MRKLMLNLALAGKNFTAETSGRTYVVDPYGMISVHPDDAERGTKDYSEAAEAGFKLYDPGKLVKLKNPDYGVSKVRKEVDGHIQISDAPAKLWTNEATGHQYHADDSGVITAFEIDAAAAQAAGFKPA